MSVKQPNRQAKRTFTQKAARSGHDGDPNENRTQFSVLMLMDIASAVEGQSLLYHVRSGYPLAYAYDHDTQSADFFAMHPQSMEMARQKTEEGNMGRLRIVCFEGLESTVLSRVPDRLMFPYARQCLANGVLHGETPVSIIRVRDMGDAPRDALIHPYRLQ